jgi:ComF family protein
MAHVARPLGQLLRSAFRSRGGALDPTCWDAIVPVPLHPRRLTERGYNQAALLARYAIHGLGLQLAPWRALRRIRATAPQPRRDRRARQANVHRAFAAGPGVCGLRLLLVDDVLTTGATAAACSEALLAAGAAAVGVLALARAE